MTTRNKYDKVSSVLNNIYTISSIIAGVASVAIVAIASAREQDGKRRIPYGRK